MAGNTGRPFATPMLPGGQTTTLPAIFIVDAFIDKMLKNSHPVLWIHIPWQRSFNFVRPVDRPVELKQLERVSNIRIVIHSLDRKSKVPKRGFEQCVIVESYEARRLFLLSSSLDFAEEPQVVRDSSGRLAPSTFAFTDSSLQVTANSRKFLNPPFIAIRLLFYLRKGCFN